MDQDSLVKDPLMGPSNNPVGQDLLSHQGWWVHSMGHLFHLCNQSLFDHNPICLTCQINLPQSSPSQLPKSSYFKTTPKILQSSTNIIQLQIACKTLTLKITNVRRHFFLTTKHLQIKYKSIQTTQPLLANIQDTIHTKLASLKYCLQSDISLDLLVEYMCMASLLRNIEIGEANKWRRKSGMK